MTLCNISQSLSQSIMGATSPQRKIAAADLLDWAEAHIQIARMTLTIKLDRNCIRFQLANRIPPLSFTESASAPSAGCL
jgi:hypothetical protein